MNLEESFVAWRKERVTIEHVELLPILDHKKPISEAFEDWKRLKGMIQEGDELWTFCSPKEEWDKLMGWQGLVLIRKGNLVDFCVTSQN